MMTADGVYESIIATVTYNRNTDEHTLSWECRLRRADCLVVSRYTHHKVDAGITYSVNVAGWVDSDICDTIRHILGIAGPDHCHITIRCIRNHS